MIRYLLIAGWIFFTTAGMSQQFTGGLTAGLVGSQVAGDNFSGYKKGGIFAGGFVALNLSDKSSLQMELTYFQKGSRENPNEENGYSSYLLRINYVEMPLLYQYKTGKFIIEGGPSVGVSTNSYEKINEIPESDAPDYDKPARYTFQINLGLVFVATPVWHVMIRTNNSFSNIRTSPVGVRRLWATGQFNDALVLGVRYVL